MMTADSVLPPLAPVNPEDDPNLVLIPAEVHRYRVGGISRTTEWRRRKADPNWPRVVTLPNGKDGYVDAESRAHVQRIIEASKTNGTEK
jgi:hypothetical protein